MSGKRIFVVTGRYFFLGPNKRPRRTPPWLKAQAGVLPPLWLCHPSGRHWPRGPHQQERASWAIPNGYPVPVVHDASSSSPCAFPILLWEFTELFLQEIFRLSIQEKKHSAPSLVCLLHTPLPIRLSGQLPPTLCSSFFHPCVCLRPQKTLFIALTLSM